MSPRARIGIVLAAVAVLVIGFVVAKGGGDDKGSDDAQATATAPGPPATDAAPGGTTDDDAAPAPETTATTPAKPAIPTITVVGAKPQGGVRELSFTKGETIRFRVKSDTADEIHFHGYDVGKDVAAGGSVTFSVPAKIEGIFEVELEEHGTQIAKIEVDPS